MFGDLGLLIMSNIVNNEVTRSVRAVDAHNDDDHSTYLYKFSFFDPEFRPQRRKILYILTVPLFFTLVLMWAGVSIFFGSLPASPILNRLDVYVIDLDHGFLGTQIVNGINASFQAQPNGLRWSFDATITSPADAQAVVLDERAWAVVQGIRLFLRTLVQFAQLTTTVSPNASTSLTDALSVGDAAYDPYSSVVIYYATARQQVTTNDYVLATLLPIVEGILAQAGISHTASFLSSIADNPTALSTSLICPQCLATPFSFTKVDLIPFSKLQSTYTVTSLLIYVRCYLLSFYILLLCLQPHLHQPIFFLA